MTPESPAEYIRHCSLTDLIRLKVQQIQFKKNGLARDISYHSFLEDWQRENARRKLAVSTGEVIYGPVEYKEADYFDHVFSRELSAYELLQEQRVPLSDSQLRAIYEKMRPVQFKRPDTVDLEELIFPFADKTERDRARERVNEAKSLLDSGIALEEVAKKFSPSAAKNRIHFDATNAKTARMEYPLEFVEASKMKAGEIGSVLETRSCFVILKCVTKEQNQFWSFEEVTPLVRRRYLQAQYSEQIDALVKEAKVSINDSAYHAILP
jgi:parvulin-like peptidyl-prolyl isomerase